MRIKTVLVITTRFYRLIKPFVESLTVTFEFLCPIPHVHLIKGQCFELERGKIGNDI